MKFVGWMRFAFGHHPIVLINFGEKDVSMCERMMYTSDIKPFGKTDCLFIDRCASDDKNFFFMLMPADCHLQLIECFATLK